MNKITFAALVLVLAAPAGAQEYREQQAKAAQESYNQLQAENARRRADPAPYAGRVLDVMLAYPKGPVFAGILNLLNERKIEVYVVSQAEAVKTGVFVKDVAGTATPVKAITISDTLSSNPSVYAALIAAEAAPEMYADMPAGVERSYLRAATVARAYTEEGGSLPLLDGNPNDTKAVKAAVGEAAPDESVLDEAARADAAARFQAFIAAGAAKPKS
ncbi:MAG: hypothetical protein ACHQ2Z_08655 [Elusimicrobiota bacterium]